MNRTISLLVLACLMMGTACATSRKPASDTSAEDKVQYDKYLRKVERQDARLGDRFTE